MHIFFSVGEPSGDQHGAQLMQELRWRYPEAQFSGFGGPHMQQAGLDCLYPLTDLAVMGIGSVLPLIGKFLRLNRRAGQFLKSHRPDAVVLIDFPGFNWWIAAQSKRAGIPVYYYCPPQLWAWAPWRIRKVRKYVDCVLSVLPFEAAWYRERGINVEYVGHPFFDEVRAHVIDGEFCDRLTEHGGPTVAILPGSRKQEVNRNFPIMLEVIRNLLERHPAARFPVACYKRWHHDRCKELIAQSPHLRGVRGDDRPITLHVGRTPEIIESSDCALMVSGSVSLELLARRTPAAVMYHADWFMNLAARTVITAKYMSLPNLMVGRPIMPEFPFYKRVAESTARITAQLDDWLSHPDSLAAAKAELETLADEVVQPGGVSNAADAIIRQLGLPESSRRAA